MFRWLDKIEHYNKKISTFWGCHAYKAYSLENPATFIYSKRISSGYSEVIIEEDLTKELIDDTFRMLEKDLCPHCGGSKNQLKWLINKEKVCSNCKGTDYYWNNIRL